MKIILFLISFLLVFTSSAMANTNITSEIKDSALQGNINSMEKIFVHDMNDENQSSWEDAYQWGCLMIEFGYPENKHFNQAWLDDYFYHLLGPKVFARTKMKTRQFIVSMKKLLK